MVVASPARSAELAAFASGASLDRLPPEVSDAAAAALVASARAARAYEPPAALQAVLGRLAAPRQCTVLATGDKTAAGAAAHLNATAALRGAPAEFGVRRIAAVVAPACLAAAELDGRPELALLPAVAVGLEVALRVASALGSGPLRRGFDLLGSAGRIGAATGAARTLGANTEEVLAAIGFAATEAAGPFRAVDGELADVLGAKAAADGVEAAVLASAGLRGPAEPLEGRRGLFALQFADGDPDVVTRALGERWLLADAERLADGGAERLASAPAGVPVGWFISAVLG